MAVRQTLKNLFQRRGEVEKGLQNLNDIETIHTEIKHKVDELAKKAIELQHSQARKEVLFGALENVKYISKQITAMTKAKASTLNRVWITSRAVFSGSNGSKGAMVSFSIVSLRGGLRVGR